MSMQPGPTQLVPEGQNGPRHPQMMQLEPPPQLKRHRRPHICPGRQVGFGGPGIILRTLGNPKGGGGIGGSESSSSDDSLDGGVG